MKKNKKMALFPQNIGNIFVTFKNKVYLCIHTGKGPRCY